MLIDMEQKRILVYGMVGTNRGGIENFLLKMNSKMSGNTIFDYVVEGTECIHENVIKERGGKVIFIAPRRAMPFRNIFDDYKLLKNQKGNYASVYFNLSSLSWLFPIIIARIFRYRVFVHSHNADFIPANSSWLHKVSNRLNKRLLSFFDIMRLTCSQVASDFMFCPKDTVEMIYNAIDVNQFKYSEVIRKKKREELSIKPDMFVLGFVGRLAHQKNPHYLVKIMESLSTMDNVLMLVCGDGPLRQEVEAETQNELSGKIIFLGNRTDINELYQAMDVFILPSFHEGLPYVVVEAQTAGLICLVSEFVTRQVNYSQNVHFLPISGDIKVWAEEIIKVKESPIDRKAAGVVMESSPFNIDKEAKRLEALLTSEKSL